MREVYELIAAHPRISIFLSWSILRVIEMICRTIIVVVQIKYGNYERTADK